MKKKEIIWTIIAIIIAVTLIVIAVALLKDDVLRVEPGHLDRYGSLVWIPKYT